MVEYFENLIIESNNSFPVTPYSRFLLNNLPECQGLNVVDFGCGNGILTFAMDRKGASKSTGIEIRNEAEILFNKNKINNLCSNSYWCSSEDGGKIEDCSLDVIISNPASLPSKGNDIPFFMQGGETGNSMIFELLEFSIRKLKSNGCLLFLHTSLIPSSLTIRKIDEYGFSYSIINSFKSQIRESYSNIWNLILENKILFPEISFEEIDGVIFENVSLYKLTK